MLTSLYRRFSAEHLYHGDLKGDNILIRGAGSETPTLLLTDLALTYDPDGSEDGELAMTDANLYFGWNSGIFKRPARFFEDFNLWELELWLLKRHVHVKTGNKIKPFKGFSGIQNRDMFAQRLL